MKQSPPPGDSARGDGSAGTHKLWGGRFKAGPAPALTAVNRSIGIDFRLWPFDVWASKEWAGALATAGVLTADERSSIEDGLTRVGTRLDNGELPVDSDEDVHTMIDRLLHDEIGEVASKLHTGRSRNDQVSTATRLLAMVSAQSIESEVRALQAAMLQHAESLVDAVMPAYTHLQRAQPVSGAHWMLSHFWPLERDRNRIAIAMEAASSLPLGSGAIAGSAYRIPREELREQLAFLRLSENSIDAVGDRDFVADLLYAISLLGVHLSRLAEDLILFGSSEFGFVRFGDSFTTGSSMMPQKRNPDALEIARGFAARSLGGITSILATMKGLPSGYNKDLQDDKRILFDSVDSALLVLPAVTGALAECTFQADAMERAVTSGMMATDLADYLVGKGVSFRDAHGAVGSLVRAAEEASCELSELPPERFTSAHAAFAADAKDWLDARASIARRDVAGGTGPNAVRAQIEAARAVLDEITSHDQAESRP